MITECLAYGAYSAVHVPTELDQPIEEMLVKEEYVEKNTTVTMFDWHQNTYCTIVNCGKK